MRWIKKKPVKEGDTRFVRKFLFFPLELSFRKEEVKETRWLEFAYIVQRYVVLQHSTHEEWYNEEYWDNLYFDNP